MSNGSEKTKERIFTLGTILLGAAISFVSTTWATNRQASYQREQQREQFLMEKRVVALKDFSVAINNGTELLAKYEKLERSLKSLRHPVSRKEIEKVVSEGLEAQKEQSRFNASIGPQTVLMNSVFKVKVPSFKFEPLVLPEELDLSHDRYSEERFLQLSQELKTNTHRAREVTAKLIDEYQDLFEELSNTVY